MDCSPSGSSVHGISQARKLELVAISFSRGSSWPRDQTPVSWFGSFPGGLDGKASAHNAGDLGSIPGLERSPEEGNGNPLQYSHPGNPMDRGAWWATVHGVTKESDMTQQLNNNNFLHRQSCCLQTEYFISSFFKNFFLDLLKLLNFQYNMQ